MTKVYLKLSRTSLQRILFDEFTGNIVVSQTKFTKSELIRIIDNIGSSDDLFPSREVSSPVYFNSRLIVRAMVHGMQLVGFDGVKLSKFPLLLYLLCYHMDIDKKVVLARPPYFYIDCFNYRVSTVLPSLKTKDVVTYVSEDDDLPF